MIDYLNLNKNLKMQILPKLSNIKTNFCFSFVFIILVVIISTISMNFINPNQIDFESKKYGAIYLGTISSFIITTIYYLIETENGFILYETKFSPETIKKAKIYGINDISKFKENINEIEKNTDFYLLDNKEKFINEILNELYQGPATLKIEKAQEKLKENIIKKINK
jgi:hypothetical protein